jgi:hypothetical protein
LVSPVMVRGLGIREARQLLPLGAAPIEPIFTEVSFEL